MGLPDGYQLQNPDRCKVCHWIFRMFDYDDGDTFFCRFGARARPNCGSVCMREIFGQSRGHITGRHNRRREFTRGMVRWDKWSNGREVSPLGVCPKFRRVRP